MLLRTELGASKPSSHVTKRAQYCVVHSGQVHLCTHNTHVCYGQSSIATHLPHTRSIHVLKNGGRFNPMCAGMHLQLSMAKYHLRCSDTDLVATTTESQAACDHALYQKWPTRSPPVGSPLKSAAKRRPYEKEHPGLLALTPTKLTGTTTTRAMPITRQTAAGPERPVGMSSRHTQTIICSSKTMAVVRGE